MPETRRQFTAEFREGAVRIVRETGRPIAQVARELGINAGTLGNWVAKDGAGGPPRLRGLGRLAAGDMDIAADAVPRPSPATLPSRSRTTSPTTPEDYACLLS